MSNKDDLQVRKDNIKKRVISVVKRNYTQRDYTKVQMISIIKKIIEGELQK